MAPAALEEVTRLADQFSADEQRELIEHLSRRAVSAESREPAGAVPPAADRPPKSLYGIWEGHFPEDFDIDAVLHEIRHEWEKEWPELFSP